MRRALGLLVSTVFLGGSAMAMGGCKDKSAGDRIGLYTVTATRTQNACGQQLTGKVASAQFNVVLSVNDAVLTWAPVDATAATGTYNATLGTFSLSQESSIQAISADTRTGTVGCVLHRVDIIEGTLNIIAGDAGTDAGADASADVSTSLGGGPNAIVDGGGTDAATDAATDAGIVATSFTAQETIGYGTESGDCTALIGVGSGQALTLPCQEGYQFTAVRIGP